jgi:hypothetical protein
MEKKNFSEKVWELRNEIIYNIMWKVNANGGEIKIPYYYDEDDYNDDIENLIDDEYEVFVGKTYDNLSVTIQNYCGYRINADIIALDIKNDRLNVITSKQEVYYATDVYDINDLVNIYEKIME